MKQIKRNVVERLIAETGLSPRAWAIQHGFAQQTVNAWLHGDRNIGGKNLSRLAAALRVDPAEISCVVFKLDSDQIAAVERDREEIVGLFGQLTDIQRSRILRLAQSLVDANQMESEIERVRDFGES